MNHDQDGTGLKNREAAKPVRHTGNNRKWGFTDQELAARPTVFREGLMTGKTVLISGGGTGMGKAMAFLFARLGGNVIICGRREELLAETSASIERFTGRKVAYKSMSIREENDVDALIDECFDRHGGIDILINNAGGQFPQDAIDFTRKGWRAVIDLNLNGTWYMMQTTAQHWRDRNRGGSIINIVANVERGMPQAAHTCAARAGVIYLSKTVATEWAPLNIRVNCIAPGTVETEGFRVYPDEAVSRFNEANPMKKLGNAWDIAEAAVYLSGPSGDFITGELLVVDGGQAQWGVVWPAGTPAYFRTGQNA
ncbi:MAG TPA: SDR family oxidoreductase [Sphingomonadales bacterium]